MKLTSRLQDAVCLRNSMECCALLVNFSSVASRRHSHRLRTSMECCCALLVNLSSAASCRHSHRLWNSMECCALLADFSSVASRQRSHRSIWRSRQLICIASRASNFLCHLFIGSPCSDHSSIHTSLSFSHTAHRTCSNLKPRLPCLATGESGTSAISGQTL